MTPDWTAPLDDMLTNRWIQHGCACCGARPAVWQELRQLRSGLSVAINLCASCHRNDPERIRLDQVLTQRFQAKL